MSLRYQNVARVRAIAVTQNIEVAQIPNSRHSVIPRKGAPTHAKVEYTSRIGSDFMRSCFLMWSIMYRLSVIFRQQVPNVRSSMAVACPNISPLASIVADSIIRIVPRVYIYRLAVMRIRYGIAKLKANEQRATLVKRKLTSWGFFRIWYACRLMTVTSDALARHSMKNRVAKTFAPGFSILTVLIHRGCRTLRAMVEPMIIIFFIIYSIVKKSFIFYKKTSCIYLWICYKA